MPSNLHQIESKETKDTFSPTSREQPDAIGAEDANLEPEDVPAKDIIKEIAQIAFPAMASMFFIIQKELVNINVISKMNDEV